jgi:hypothetical protein
MSTITVPTPVPTANAVRREQRPTAVAVGVLYILATAIGVTAAALGAPTDLQAMAGERGAVLGTALAVTLMALCVTGVAVMLYPVLVADAGSMLRRGMATGYLASRIAEGTLFLLSAATLLAMLTLSEAVVGSSGTEAAAVAVVAEALHDYAHVAAQTSFVVGAMLVYWLLYVSQRVPRWLSLWGLLGCLPFLVGGLLLPFTDDPTAPLTAALYAPIAVQEMVLALWLIARGFSPATARTRDGSRS